MTWLLSRCPGRTGSTAPAPRSACPARYAGERARCPPPRPVLRRSPRPSCGPATSSARPFSASPPPRTCPGPGPRQARGRHGYARMRGRTAIGRELRRNSLVRRYGAAGSWPRRYRPCRTSASIRPSPRRPRPKFTERTTPNKSRAGRKTFSQLMPAAPRCRLGAASVPPRRRLGAPEDPRGEDRASAALLPGTEALAQGYPGHREQDGDRQGEESRQLGGEYRSPERESRGVGDRLGISVGPLRLDPGGRAGRGGRPDQGEQARRVAGADERAADERTRGAVEVRDGPERQRGLRRGAR